jgi:hypothetical protein
LNQVEIVIEVKDDRGILWKGLAQIANIFCLKNEDETLPESHSSGSTASSTLYRAPTIQINSTGSYTNMDLSGAIELVGYTAR